ncbi:Endothelin-converting enzyme 2 [Mortierella alpina]|nr:Endothelin-converting enzyme 2 [Mortierella alpina]
MPIGSLVLDLDRHLELMLSRSTQSSLALQIQSYFVWRAVQQTIHQIDPKYGQFLKPFSEPKTGRWKYCTGFVNSAMGRMIGPYFAQQVRTEPTMAMDVVQTIQNKLAEAFNGLSWVQLPKRTREILKIGRALTFVGVGNGTECLSALEYLYKTYTVDPDDFFGNWIRFAVWRRANAFKGLKGFTFEEEVSKALPQEVSILHDLEGGKIQVPVGILQPPLFHNDYPDYVNFARMGSMIAQEYARGLDFGEGPFARSMDMFCEEPTHCEQLRWNRENYESSAFGDPDVFGRFEGELAAHSIGLQLAFDAWSSRYQSDGNSTSYCDSRRFSPEELFFISYGSSLCEKQRHPQAREVHLCKWRINGPLANSPSFAKAFNCTRGAPMNPERKYSIFTKKPCHTMKGDPGHRDP